MSEFPSLSAKNQTKKRLPRRFFVFTREYPFSTLTHRLPTPDNGKCEISRHLKSIKMEQEYLSTRETAQMLGVALRTVQLWVEAGVLSAWKTAGGHRRIPRRAVDELLEKRRQSTGGAPNSPDSQKKSAESFRILLVEDDQVVRKMFAMIFEAWNAPVILDIASDGFEGLVKLGQNRPDLLITDLIMPGMDGFKMIQHLRNLPEMQQLEIIVVTSQTSDQVKSYGTLPQDIRIFNKPVPFNELKALINARLGLPS